jgi:tetratricopeptide (TPR) repeat protein
LGDNSLEEHLLERISALEGAIARANERFEQLLELAQQQATGSFYDHMMLEALTEVLAEMHAIDADELEQRWKNRVARHYEETVERERLDERCALIVATYRGARREEFAELVEEGTQLISDGHPRRGLRVLENALQLDEQNAELSFTIGEHYFHLGKSVEASVHLRRAVGSQSDHFGARLLLGLLTGDQGESESARVHLERALSLDQSSFAAHYGLGRLLACEGELTQALTHLKRALALKPTPEMHYLVGRVYWEQGRRDQALKHLQKAVRLDPRFDEAFYSLGLIYWHTNQTSEAREHFRTAYEINPRDSHYRVAIEARAGDVLPVPPALGWASLMRRRKVKGGEMRFIELLWRDLNAVSLTPLQARKNPRK